MGESGLSERPSLYLAFRLAGLVRKVRHRLQERVLVRKRSKNPFGNSQRRGLRLRATSDAEKLISPARVTVKTESVSPVEHGFNGQWANSLLHELDGHADRKTSPLARVAADDKLFLSNSTNTLVDTVSPTTSPQHAAYLFDLSSLLIDRLEVFRSQQPTESYHSSCGLSDLRMLLDATFIANLLHLLFRLQRRLFQVLINQTIQQIEDITRHWREYLQQQKKLGNNWFKEWPDGRRPLNTTWPWNIRPSLVVLWGVCWMFYYNGSAHVEDSKMFWVTQDSELSVPHLGEEVPTSNIYNQAEDTSQLWGEAAADAPVVHDNVSGDWGPNFGLAEGVVFRSGSAAISPEDNVARLDPVTTDPQLSEPAQHRGGVNVWANDTGYTGYPCMARDVNLEEPSDPINRHHIASATVGVSSTAPVVSGSPLVGNQGFPILTEPLNAGQFGYNPAQLPQHPPFDFQLYVTTPPHAIPSNLPSSSRLSSPQMLRESPVVGSDMATSVGYISPRDDGPGRLPPTAYSIEKSSPSTAPTGRPKISVRREQGPPKNEAGQMFCAHEDCRKDPPTFRRQCEWNKHMDKHDRPYRCREPGCDKVRGFTYSGGLLRHQREVHKKNEKAKSPRMCPYTDCNRSIGDGFTRQENLNEHIRRRHRPNDISPNLALARTPDVEAMPAPSASTLPFPSPATKKRKRSTDEHTLSTATSDDGSEYSVDPREEVKRLRLQLEEKDRRVRELEDIIKKAELKLLF